jgi:hypothetical protein
MLWHPPLLAQAVLDSLDPGIHTLRENCGRSDCIA